LPSRLNPIKCDNRIMPGSVGLPQLVLLFAAILVVWWKYRPDGS